MANSKNKCTGCKKLVPIADLKQYPVGKFCKDKDCVIDYARRPPPDNAEKVRKLAKKEDNLQKKLFYASDLKTRKNAAKKACHSYIKARDVGNSCICCGRNLGKNYDSGHFLESGNNPKIRYDEDTIFTRNQSIAISIKAVTLVIIELI